MQREIISSVASGNVIREETLDNGDTLRWWAIGGGRSAFVMICQDYADGGGWDAYLASAKFTPDEMKQEILANMEARLNNRYQNVGGA